MAAQLMTGYVVRHPDNGGLLCRDGKFRQHVADVGDIRIYRYEAWARKVAFRVWSDADNGRLRSSATVVALYCGDVVSRDCMISRNPQSIPDNGYRQWQAWRSGRVAHYRYDYK